MNFSQKLAQRTLVNFILEQLEKAAKQTEMQIDDMVIAVLQDIAAFQGWDFNTGELSEDSKAVVGEVGSGIHDPG